MWRYLGCLFLVGFIIGGVGYKHSSALGQPLQLGPTTTPLVVAQMSALATPYFELSSPIPLPTVTPTLRQVAISTLPPHPERYNSDDGSIIAVTPIPAAPQLTCNPQVRVIECYDDLLDMDFSYPAFMGQILYTSLRHMPSGYDDQPKPAGYSYEYIFQDGENDAGGRSRDFIARRGPMYTDQSGIRWQDTTSQCEKWVAAICQELGPSALMIVMLPQAEWLCMEAMMFSPIPRGILVLDLPEHPLINGFSFSFELLSAEAKAEFQDQWYGDRECAPETKEALGAAMEQLRQDLPAGTADPAIQKRYDAMIQIVESIQSPFIATSSRERQ